MNLLLRLFVTTFAEVLIADDALGVDEVERRPVVVVEGFPDLVVVVHCNGIVDVAIFDCLPYAVDLVLEPELWGVDADDDQPVVRIRP